MNKTCTKCRNKVLNLYLHEIYKNSCLILILLLYSFSEKHIFILVIWHVVLETNRVLYCTSKDVKKNVLANLAWTFNFFLPKRDCV